MEHVHRHSAILYGSDEPQLVEHVVQFLSTNLADGGPCVIVATPEHRAAFLAALRADGLDPERALADGLLVCLDAVTTMEELLVDGRADWRAFDRGFVELVRNLRMRGPLRVYGEIVGILWALGRHDIAVELESHWNRLRRRVDLDVLCAYDVDVASPDFIEREIEGIVRTHGELLTCGGQLPT